MNKEAITRRQMQKIRKLANGQLTTRQISEQIGLNYQLVYAFVARENLDVKFLPHSKIEGRKVKENVFNVHEQAWL